MRAVHSDRARGDTMKILCPCQATAVVQTNLLVLLVLLLLLLELLLVLLLVLLVL